jgi:hypothetical protein
MRGAAGFPVTTSGLSPHESSSRVKRGAIGYIQGKWYVSRIILFDPVEHKICDDEEHCPRIRYREEVYCRYLVTGKVRLDCDDGF